MAGVWSIPLPLEVALKFFGEDTLDSWNVSILHYLLEIALGSDKICSAVRPTGTRLSTQTGKTSECHKKRICASVCDQFEMDRPGRHTSEYNDLCLFHRLPIQLDMERSEHINGSVPEVFHAAFDKLCIFWWGISPFLVIRLSRIFA